MVVGGAAAPALAADTWTFNHANVVRFTTYHNLSVPVGYYARLYDLANDGVPVRAQYHRTSDVEYNVSYSSGPGGFTQTPTLLPRIDWVIACNDYSIGDDCSGKFYG